MPELEWSHPAALGTLVLPLLLLLLSVRRDRPRSTPVGTFELWRDLPRGAGGAGRRRRIPLARWLLLAAVTCAGLALAGPRRARPVAARAWRVVVDPSPSMFLPHPDGGTRLDVALTGLEALRRGERLALSWLRPATGDDERAEGSPPPGWRAAPWPARGEPDWERYDAPGTIWLTDAAPDPLPRFAGVVAAGGDAVPGPVGTVGRRRLDWDGDELIEGGVAPPRRVAIEPGLPAAIEDAVRAWEEAREISGAEGEVALTIAVVTGGDEIAATVGRDGWSARALVRVAPSIVDGVGLTTWLAAGREPRAAITAGPGRVCVGVVELEEVSGDPAAFAVSWAELLDGVVLAPRGTVALRERRAAGPSVRRAPTAEGPLGVEGPPSWPLVSLLCAAAAGLAFLALVLGRGRL